MAEELAKGFTCACGAFHKFSSWVYAHWTERLTHTCPDCKVQHYVQSGKVTKK